MAIKPKVTMQAQRLKLIGDLLKHTKIRPVPKDECSQQQNDSNITDPGLSKCIRCALICAIVDSEAFKIQLQKRCCTSGETGIWIGLDGPAMLEFAGKVRDCASNYTGPINPLGITIVNPP